MLEKIKRSKLKIWFLLGFLFWPFGLLLANLKRIEPKNLRLSMLLFSTFYGLCFIVDYNSGSDSVFYASQLESMYNNFNFKKFLSILYSDGQTVDLYQPVTTFLVSIFTDNYIFLFMVYGFVFGYFYSNNIYIILQEVYGYKFSILGSVLFFYLAFIIHIGDGINGVRMWTASHVFIYGVLSYIVKGRRKKMLWVILSPFFHFSLAVPTALFLIFVLTREYINLKIVYLVFILSFIMQGISIELLRNLTDSILPQVFKVKADSYVSEAVQDRITNTSQSAIPLPKLFLNYASKIFLIISATFVYFKRKELKYVENRLLIFGLLLYSLFNLLSHIPSLGRYLSIASFITLAACIMFYFRKQYTRYFKRSFYFLIPVGLTFIIIKIRFFLEYPSVWLVIGNPILVILGGNETGFYR